MIKNRQGIAFLLVALLVLDAVSAQLGSVAKPTFRGSNKVLLMNDNDVGPEVKTPKMHQAIIDNRPSTVGASKAKGKVPVGGVKHADHGEKKEDNYDEDDKGDDYNVECKPPVKPATECTKNPPRFPSYHNTYELKYQTIGCSMRTVDQIVEQCATIDIIKEKPECVNRVENYPVKVNKVVENKKKIKVVVPVKKNIQVLKTVQKPVETLVTECVTVYEVVEKEVCVDTLQCYDTNERKIVEEKVKIRYEEPKKTEIRVVKPVQKKIKVIRTACAKYEASISQKTCTKEKKKSCDKDKKYEKKKEHNYAGNQYAAKQVVKAQKKK
jgi:hypothetical protein